MILHAMTLSNRLEASHLPEISAARKSESHGYIGGNGFPGSGLGIPGGPKDTFDACRAVRTLGAGAAMVVVPVERIKPIMRKDADNRFFIRSIFLNFN
jgi:hypothetical protein